MEYYHSESDKWMRALKTTKWNIDYENYEIISINNLYKIAETNNEWGNQKTKIKQF